MRQMDFPLSKGDYLLRISNGEVYIVASYGLLEMQIVCMDDGIA